VSSPRIPRSFPRFFFHSCRLAPSSRTWISVELSRSDDFNLSTGRKKSGTHSNRGEPPVSAGAGVSAASFILSDLSISVLSLSPFRFRLRLSSAGRSTNLPLASPLQPLPLAFILIPSSSSPSSSSFSPFECRAMEDRLLRGCCGLQRNYKTRA